LYKLSFKIIIILIIITIIKIIKIINNKNIFQKVVFFYLKICPINKWPSKQTYYSLRKLVC